MLLQKGSFDSLYVPEAYFQPEELLICGVVAVELEVVVGAQPQAHCLEADQ